MADPTRTGASFGKGAITPSDTADLTQVNGDYPRALRVNAAGDVAIMAPDGSQGVWTCSGPETVVMQTKRVLATGTTVAAGKILPIY